MNKDFNYEAFSKSELIHMLMQYDKYVIEIVDHKDGSIPMNIGEWVNYKYKECPEEPIRKTYPLAFIFADEKHVTSIIASLNSQLNKQPTSEKEIKILNMLLQYAEYIMEILNRTQENGETK